MATRSYTLFLVAAALLTAACGTSTTAANETPSAAGSPSAEASPSAAAVPATTDPCQLVTSSEASQLSGASYGAGKEETTTEGGKLCWYGAGTTNVFEVFVAQASSASVAQANWDSEKAKVEASLQQGVNVPGVTININVSDTTISGADRAAAGSLTESFSGHTLAGSGVYLLKGAVFCAVIDLLVDHSAPTTSAMEGQAQTVIGRLP